MAYSGMVEMGREEERRTMDEARYGKDSAKGPMLGPRIGEDMRIIIIIYTKGHYRVFPGGC